MTTDRETRNGETGSDAIGRLIQAAGSREPLPDLRAARLRAACEPVWRDEVAAGRRRTRRRHFGLLAATLALAALTWLLIADSRQPAPSTGVELVRATGFVGLAAAGRGTSRELRPGDPIPAGAVVEVGAARAALRLPDCASVRLDVGTRVVVSSVERIALERGAIYVDSTVKSCDLRVATPFGQITKLGTQFEVRLEGDTTRIRVREGGVTLRSAAAAIDVDVRRQEEVVIRPDGGSSRRVITIHDKAWEWASEIAPPPPGDDLTLGGFLDWAAREMGWRVRFADPGLRPEARAIQIELPTIPASPSELVPVVLAACELDSSLDADVLLVARIDSSAP